MSKGISYQPKPMTNNQCFVMLPATFLGRATRSSIQSLRMQLEKRFNPNHVVMKVQLEALGSMQRLTLVIDDWDPVNIVSEDNTLKAGGTVADTVEQLYKIEQWLGSHVEDQIKVTFEEQTLTLTSKPNIKAVPKVHTAIDRLLLIDGSNLLTTGYFATRKNMLKNEDGLYTNGVYIMTRRIIELISRFKPSHVAIAWDEGRETFRRRIYPEYKATRSETETELKQQFSTAQELFSKIGIAQYSHKEIEADDVIGTIAATWEIETKGNCFIISNDKDLFQLLSDQTSQLISKNSQDYNITPQSLHRRFNIHPSQWVDCKALLGDSSDNIPGVTGVGEKSTYPLIEKYGSLENLYENLGELEGSEFNRYKKKIEEGKEMAFLSKQLAMIKRDAHDLIPFTLNDLELKVKRSALLHFLQVMGFKTIVQSIEKGLYRIG